ncbi:MAG TPA: tetratricopeptide repeat protein [Pyrinomonadaceae bacterium]
MKEPDLSHAKKRIDEAYNRATDRKDYEGALKICNEVLSDHPDMPHAVRKKAAIYADMKNFAEATALMSHLIAQIPNELEYYFSRGRWYVANADWAEAVEDMTKALELGSEQNFHYFTESAYFFRAVALSKLGRHSEAVADCEHVRDDFLIYIYSTGKISKSDILEQAARRN